MKSETRRNLRGIFARALVIVFAAGIVLGYCYSVPLALDMKAKIDADEPSGEWFVQGKNENRLRYIGPQSADALASSMRFDLGEEKSEAQTAKLKAHFERVLERGAVFQDNMDMLHFGPALMLRFRRAAEYERRRAAEHPEDAEYPTIRALFDLPESASWTELENALMDGDLNNWPDAKTRLDAWVDDAVRREKELTRETLRITFPFALVFVFLGFRRYARSFVQKAKSNSRGIRFLQVRGIAKTAALFLLIWCALGSNNYMLNGLISAHSWRDNYLTMKSFLRETPEDEQTTRKLLYRIRVDNASSYSRFDNFATMTEIRRHRGKRIATSMLISAATLPISAGILAWIGVRWRAALLANQEETDANKTEE